MFKTNAALSKEASTLYGEHKNIVDAIKEKQDYVEAVERQKVSIAQAALGGALTGESAFSQNYVMDLDAGLVKHDIKSLEEGPLAQNQLKAEDHLAKNPKLRDVAIKLAQEDGVDLNLGE